MIGNESGHLLECVELYGKLINKCETRKHCSSLLSILLKKNLHSVKCYEKLHMNVLTSSLWENFWWGLIYFDQYTYRSVQGVLVLMAYA